MKRRALLILLIVVIFGSGFVAWAPWITEDYAYDLVMEHLGGRDSEYNYLGEMISLKDIPKTFIKLPFVSLVYFPGEAMYIVSFFGIVF
ncbi:MAG: hypothetical protein ACFE8M_03150 [Candidatus Hermodarchaeota archaeon]